MHRPCSVVCVRRIASCWGRRAATACCTRPRRAALATHWCADCGGRGEAWDITAGGRVRPPVTSRTAHGDTDGRYRGWRRCTQTCCAWPTPTGVVGTGVPPHDRYGGGRNGSAARTPPPHTNTIVWSPAPHINSSRGRTRPKHMHRAARPPQAAREGSNDGNRRAQLARRGATGPC